MIHVIRESNWKVYASFETVEAAVWWVEMAPHARSLPGPIRLCDGEGKLLGPEHVFL